MRFMTVLRVLVYCGIALPAAAQSTFADLHVKGRPTLYVTEPTGKETKGRLVSLTESEIVLQVKDATRTFTPDRVAFIERRGDSLKNGAIVGVVLGVWCAFVCGQGLDSSSQLPLAVAADMLLPIGIDAAIPGRTRIWPPRMKQKK